MPQFLRNCGRGDIRGRPAGRLSFFLGCARGATEEEFRSLWSARRAPPSTRQPFEKGWTENFSWLPYTKSPQKFRSPPFCQNRFRQNIPYTKMPPAFAGPSPV